ncbi:alkylhydroperoxidase like protein, AhpD family [Burkholderia cepacia]|nr:alkylhydroperoxidase like protein, AhpD family [Burkholderia cepacia]
MRYRERIAEVAEQMRKLRKSQPELLSAFGALGSAGTKDDALKKETRARRAGHRYLLPLR